MAEAMNIQSEQFQQTLAEALRAGPVSPCWREAVDALKAAGQSGEELALLCKARERLESGRSYRSVRAGSGFTQKLMAQIEQTEQSSTSGSGISTASFITAAAVIVILAVVGMLAWMLFSPAQDNEGKVDLRSVYFVNTVLAEDFSQKPQAPGPWQGIGALPLTAQHGLRLQIPSPFTQPVAGGGLMCPLELSPKEPVSVEAVIDIADPKTRVLAEVFLTDSPTFSSDRGISPRELIWQIDGTHTRVVLPDGRGAGIPSPVQSVDRSVTVRLLVSRDKCIIEQDGAVVWSGEHQLSQNSPRRLGLRLLARGNAKATDVTIRSLRVRKP